MTKRQVQLTGTRKWWGNQLQQMQDNIYEHLENLFLRHATGHLIIKQPYFDSSHNITEVGYILMNGADGFRICEISGTYTGTNGSVFYITQDFVSVDTDTYTDSGTIKDISRKYIAKDEGATAPATPYVKVDNYEFFDDAGNQIHQFQYWLEGKFYTKSNADDNAYNLIDASFLRGSVGYTKEEADDRTQNSIDVSNAFNAEELNGSEFVRKEDVGKYTDGNGHYVHFYISAIGNTTGYLVTVTAIIEANFAKKTFSGSIPTKYRPAGFAGMMDDLYSDFTIGSDGTISIENIQTTGNRILTVSYLTDVTI